MFGKRGFLIQMVNTKESKMGKTPPAEVVDVNPEEIAKIATEFTAKAIGAIGIAIAGHKVLSTICEITLIAAKAKFK
jgi:1,4-dihydroxy-2-naphthoyl-CoA synthase